MARTTLNHVLHFDEAAVQTGVNHQLLVRAGLADVAAFEHNNLVGVADGRQAHAVCCGW